MRAIRHKSIVLIGFWRWTGGTKEPTRTKSKGLCYLEKCLTGTREGYNEEFFKVLYNLSELNHFTANEIRNYMKSLYAESDDANTIDYAKEVGKELGIAIGIAKRDAEVVAAMFAKGMDVETICEITGLTEEEVNALK